MNVIFEVTGWRGGLVGTFTAPLVLLIWAKSTSEALDLALKHWQQQAEAGLLPKRASWEKVSIGPAREQNPCAYGRDVTKIMNLPMKLVQRAWEINEIPENRRTLRPRYLML